MAELNPAAPPPAPEPAAAPPVPEAKLSPGQKLAAAAPPEVPAEKPVDPPALSPKAQKLIEAGFANVANDDEAFDRLLSAYQSTKNEFSAQLQAALAEVKQVQPTTAPPAQVQDAQTGKWTWAPPAVDAGLIAKYRTAEGWKPETPADIRQAAEARQAYLDAWATKLVNDPASALDPLLEERFNKLFEQKYGQIASQQQQQTFQQKLVNDNPWLFENDPVSGKPKVGDFTALSPEGKLIDQYMAEAMTPDEHGHAMNYEQAWKYANALHRASKAEFAGKQATQALTAEQINDQKKRELLARGNASRAGSQPQPASPNQTQNRHLSFGQKMQQAAERNGVPLNPVA